MYAVQHWARQLGTHEPVGESVPETLSLWKWCHRGHNEQVSPSTTSSARLCLVAKKGVSGVLGPIRIPRKPFFIRCLLKVVLRILYRPTRSSLGYGQSRSRRRSPPAAGNGTRGSLTAPPGAAASGGYSDLSPSATI